MEKSPISKHFIENNRNKVEQREKSLPITEEQLRSECANEDFCMRALEEMLNYATDYALDVWNMKQLLADRAKYDEPEWAELFAQADSARTRLHDTYIDSIAILLRHMNEAGLDTDWAKELMPTGKLERSACGAFAIMLTYYKYVNSLKEE